MAMLLEPGMQSLRMGKAVLAGTAVAGGGSPAPLHPPTSRAELSVSMTHQLPLPSPPHTARCPPAAAHPFPGTEEPPALLPHWGNQNQLRRGNMILRTQTGRQPQQRGDRRNSSSAGSPSRSLGARSRPTGKMLHGHRPSLGLQTPRLKAQLGHQLPARAGVKLLPDELPARGEVHRDVPVCQGSNIHGPDMGYSERHLRSGCEGTGAVLWQSLLPQHRP